MREILFKAKRIDNGEWVEGNLIFTPKADEDFKAIIVPLDDNGEYTYGKDDDLGFETYYKVDPDTLCQYTGLTDKNGNKIWENDVIRCGRNTVVSWDEHFASWCLTRKGWLFKHFFGESQNPEDCKVIGNIFDNPELLEGGGEDETD